MKQNTCNIIMICKGVGKRTEQVEEERLVEYLVAEKGGTTDWYGDREIHSELREAVNDFCKLPSAKEEFDERFWNIINSYVYGIGGSAKININLVLMNTLRAVFMKDEDGNYINGFTQEQHRCSMDTLMKRG